MNKQVDSKINGLIIDDDSNFHEIVTESLSLYNFFNAMSYIDALKILSQKKQIDFILLDYKLGQDIGTTLVPNIKKKHPFSPIIMMSAYGKKQVLHKIIESKVDSFIDKPFIINDLQSKINTLLEKTGRFCSYSNHINNILTHNLAIFNLKLYTKTHHLSYKYLLRLIKEKTNVSYQELKRTSKILSIKKMLTETNFTIQVIAYKHGYSNEFSLMRQFKQYVNCTPTEYRKTQK